MGDAGSVDDTRGFEVDVVGPEVVEQPDAGAEQDGDEVDLDLVEEAGPQALLGTAAPMRPTSLSPATALACAMALSTPSVTKV